MSPRLAHGTAANFPRLILRHRIRTPPPAVLQITKIFSHVHAFFSSRKRHVAFGTLTVIFPGLVHALPDTANPRIFLAFVDINAHRPGFVQTESFVARAHETSEGVRAVAVLTYVFVLFAFVDVFEDHSFFIWAIA